MNRRGLSLAFLSACFVASFMLFSPGLAQDLDKGRLIEKVVCREEPGQSYALYLPSAFNPERKWPILFLFDPGARGPAAVEAFQTAAETYGWILAGSNNSMNGPMRDSVRAAWAMWIDARQRLPVDERRVYASGFSGGARVASVFPQVAGRVVAGIIGCGAGLSSGLKPGELKTEAFFGLTGLADFNYREMKGLDLLFDPSGVPHRFLFFEGVHSWPEQPLCTRALGWMEVLAMKGGLRSKDEKLVAAFVSLELDEARSLEAAGRLFWAADRLEAAGLMAEGLLEIQGLASRVEGLKARPEYAQFLKAEKKRDKREDNFRSNFGRVLGAVEEDETGGARAINAVLGELQIGFLKKEAKNEKTPEDRSLASRLLFEFSFATQARATDLFGKGELARAAAYFDLAIAACEEGLFRERYLYFNRARVAALAGNRKQALEFLSAAVDKGLSDIDLLETTKEFDSIRTTDRFREILEKARTRGQADAKNRKRGLMSNLRTFLRHNSIAEQIQSLQSVA